MLSATERLAPITYYPEYFVDSWKPGTSWTFIEDYVRFRGNDFDSAFEPPPPMLFFRHPSLVVKFFLGLFPVPEKAVPDNDDSSPPLMMIRISDVSPKPQPSHPAGGGTVTLTLAQGMERALAAYERGNWAEAERLCWLMLKVQPSLAPALHLLGIIAAQTQRKQEAVGLLARAAAVDPRDADAHCDLGRALHDLGRCEEALASYDRALALRPGSADILNRRGVALCDLKRAEEALASHDRALAIQPDDPDALYNRGNALLGLERFDEALASYDRALAIRPLDADTWNNRGNALAELKRIDDALENYDRALTINASDPTAHRNRGNLLYGLKRYAEAMAGFDRALELTPDDVPAHVGRSFCRLQLGDFARGWQEYEWRWKDEQLGNSRRNFPRPLWLGRESLRGRTILLHSEQGIGDTLQFCRYVRLLAEQGAKVVLEVQAPVHSLLQDLEGTVQVLARGAALPAFDCHCPLLTLPLAFGTDLSNIPHHFPYVRCDPSRLDAWRDRLGPRTKARIGIAWSGYAAHKNDRNRSIALTQMLPLLFEGADWISLQKEVRAGDADILASRPDLRHFGDELRDFADTAALVELVDLVVTVDTSVAHLAGAMAKDVWILLPANPDWRWLLEREDSPWYPTARLFRQAALGEWTPVIETVGSELARRVESVARHCGDASARGERNGLEH